MASSGTSRLGRFEPARAERRFSAESESDSTFIALPWLDNEQSATAGAAMPVAASYSSSVASSSLDVW